MIANDYEVIFDHRGCTIHDPAGREIAEIPMIKKSFHLKIPAIEEATMNVAKEKCCLEREHTKVESQKILQAWCTKKNEEEKNHLMIYQPKGNKTEAVKEKQASEVKNQRSYELEKKENKSVEIKDVVQRTRLSGIMSKRDTTEKIRSSLKVEREQKEIEVETCKRDAEKDQETEKKKHKGFGLQDAKSTVKNDSIKEQWPMLKAQSKGEASRVLVSNQRNVVQVGSVRLDLELAQEKKKLSVARTEENQLLMGKKISDNKKQALSSETVTKKINLESPKKYNKLRIIRKKKLELYL